MATTKHILIVDDLKGMRDLLQAILEDLGYRVSAASGISEMKMLVTDEDPIDLILLDINLRDGSGVKGAESLKQALGAKMPKICFVSGEKDQVTVSDALKAGGSDYLVKPIDPEVLAQKVKTLLFDNRESLFIRSSAKLSAQIENLPVDGDIEVTEIGELGLKFKTALKFKVGTLLQLKITSFEKLGIEGSLPIPVKEIIGKGPYFTFECDFTGLHESQSEKIRKLVIRGEFLDDKELLTKGEVYVRTS